MTWICGTVGVEVVFVLDIPHSDRVKLTRHDQVLEIAFERPEARNAIDLETIAALRSVVEQLAVQRDIIAVVLTSHGQDVFIAGGDLRQFARLRGESSGRTLARSMAGVTLKLEKLPQVVIAAIEGDAYGGGVELALACDLRVMSRSARLKLSQSQFGLTTAWGGASRLVATIGYSRALEVMLTAQPLDAALCRDLGLANRLAIRGQVRADALALAAQIAALDWYVATSIKRVVTAAANQPRGEAMAFEQEVFAALWAHEGHDERVEAFMNARQWRTDDEPSERT